MEAIAEVNDTLSLHYYDNAMDAMKELIDEKAYLPDLVFLDLNMPMISGWECLRQIKSEESIKRVPVIIYSTSSVEKEKELAHSLGAAGFIIKPDDYKILKELLQKQLATHL